MRRTSDGFKSPSVLGMPSIENVQRDLLQLQVRQVSSFDQVKHGALVCHFFEHQVHSRAVRSDRCGRQAHDDKVWIGFCEAVDYTLVGRGCGVVRLVNIEQRVGLRFDELLETLLSLDGLNRRDGDLASKLVRLGLDLADGGVFPDHWNLVGWLVDQLVTVGHEDGAKSGVLHDALDVIGGDDGLAGSSWKSNKLSFGALESAILESLKSFNLVVAWLYHVSLRFRLWMVFI